MHCSEPHEFVDPCNCNCCTPSLVWLNLCCSTSRPWEMCSWEFTVVYFQFYHSLVSHMLELPPSAISSWHLCDCVDVYFCRISFLLQFYSYSIPLTYSFSTISTCSCLWQSTAMVMLELNNYSNKIKCTLVHR